MFELASLPQEMGEIVLQGIRLGRLSFRRLFNLTSILAFLELVPTIVLVWGTGDQVSFDVSDMHTLMKLAMGPYGIAGVITKAVSMVPLAMLLRRIALSARGQKESRSEEIRHALRAWPWMVLAFLVYALVVGFGLMLLVVPGVILFFSLLFVGFAVVLEGLKPLPALNLSHNLVWGHWWRTLGLVLLVYIPLFLAVSIVAAILGIGTGNASDAAVHGRDLFKQGVLEMVALAFFGPFIYSILYVYYHDLKLRRQAR